MTDRFFIHDFSAFVQENFRDRYRSDQEFTLLDFHLEALFFVEPGLAGGECFNDGARCRYAQILSAARSSEGRGV